MNTRKSKIDGVGIVPLRCEICFGSIEEGQGVIALLRDGMHFAHNSCYENNDAEYILKRMDEIIKKTKNDQELFSLMDNDEKN